MKTTDEILERITAEIEFEMKLKISAFEENKFDVAARAGTRALLLEQLRDWITADTAPAGGEKESDENG